jgi:hypothetical protein
MNNHHIVSNQDIVLVRKKCRGVPTRSNCRIGVGKKRSSSGVKQSPGSETGQVKKSRETIVRKGQKQLIVECTYMF